MNPSYLNKQLGLASEEHWSAMPVRGATTRETWGLAIRSFAHPSGTGSKDTFGSDLDVDPPGGLLD